MAAFQFVGLLPGDGSPFPVMLGTLASTSTGVTFIDHGNDAVVSYDATGAGLASTGSSSALGGRISFTLFGQSVSLAGSVIDAMLAELAAGDTSSERAFLSTIESQANAATLICASVGGTDYLFVAPQNGAGVAVYAVTDSGNTLTLVESQPDASSHYAANVSAMTVVTVDGTPYLLAGSASEDGVSCYRINASGTLTEVDSFGRDESLPVQTVTAMDSTEINGTTYAVIAASDSSSLSVVEVQPGGLMAPAEHVVDSLDTRLDGVSALEIVELGSGRTLVIAGGSDGGLTVYTLLPDGHLVPCQVIEGDLESGLDRISAIGTHLSGTQLDLFVTTEGAPGAVQYTLDVSDLGPLDFATASGHHGTAADDLIVLDALGTLYTYGGAGDDIIVDGLGRDRLYGEAGADTFVIIGGDLERDRIMDFEIGIDTVDLSDWTMCYGTAWLDVYEWHNGALRINYGSESLEIFSADGQPLTFADFDNITFTFSSNYDVVRGPLEEVGEETGADLIGTVEDDVLNGTDGDDDMHAGGGDDLMISGGGTDRFWGGSGTDTVSFAGSGTAITINLSDPSQNAGAAAESLFYDIESLIGCALADSLTGDALANRLEGGDGNDWLDGLEGDDTLIGGEGHDSLLGRTGNDYIEGGAGDDNIAASDGDDEAHGGAGNDALGGGNGNDLLYGDDGNDHLGGGPGDDYLSGGDGNDQLSATYGNDTIYGGNGHDHIAGGPGTDLIYGNAGDDNIGGGAGSDEIRCGGGNDVVGAGDGHDHVWGGSGADQLNGGAGNDTLEGGTGSDRLNGGTGDDVMTGGADADTFVFAAFTAGEIDVITDFDCLGGDMLQLAGISGSSLAGRLAALTPTQLGDDVVLTYSGHTIILENVNLTDLTLADFTFV